MVSLWIWPKIENSKILVLNINFFLTYYVSSQFPPVSTEMENTKRGEVCGGWWCYKWHTSNKKRTSTPLLQLVKCKHHNQQLKTMNMIRKLNESSSEPSQDEEEDDVMDIIKQELKLDEKKGPEVDPKLAGVMKDIRIN